MLLEKHRFASAYEEEDQEYQPVSPEKIERALRYMHDLMAAEAASLAHRGFPVGPDGRIVPEKTGLTSKADQSKHRLLVAAREASWRERETTPDAKRPSNVGELLELVKTLSINQLWFGKRLVSVRTSRYDDYEHGVDNFIFDTETGEPIAAIDEATAGGMKSKNKYATRDKVNNGVSVTYGFDIEKETGRVVSRTYTKLPFFLISVTTDELIKLAGDLENQELSQYNIVNDIIEALKNQAVDAALGDPEDDRSKPVPDPVLRAAYRRALEIFKEL
jgi:hypothetical protein